MTAAATHEMHPVRYARNGDVSIAYQVVGLGPADLTIVPGFTGHLDLWWEEPKAAAFQNRLADRLRLILYDRREQGLSDRFGRAPSLEENVSDLRAVLDAAGSTRSALLGVSQGGPSAIAFAAAEPERTSALVLYGTYARVSRDEDYPYGPPAEGLLRFADAAAAKWGGAEGAGLFAPSAAGDPEFRLWWARATRAAASPRSAWVNLRRRADLDVRDRLARVRAPALVLHRAGDRVNPVDHGRYLARQLPQARYLELDGEDHLWWLPDPAQIADLTAAFVLDTAGPAHMGHEGAGRQPPEAAQTTSGPGRPTAR